MLLILLLGSFWRCWVKNLEESDENPCLHWALTTRKNAGGNNMKESHESV
jgi:hypothetical protein